MKGSAPRLLLSIALGFGAGLFTWWARGLIMANHASSRYAPSDFAQLWYAARAFLDNIDPYTVVGRGKPFEWDFPLLYPFPAVLVAAPFSFLPLPLAEAAFIGLGATVFAYAVTKTTLKTGALWAFCSFVMVNVATTAQWSLLTTGAALIPAAGFLLVCKPTIGLALFAAFPSRRALMGAALCAALSIAIWPGWIRAWLATLPAAGHMTPALFRLGGPLMLLAALRWRHWDGRLLLALSIVPHTPLPYEAIPLFLLVTCFEEAVLLILLTGVWFYAIEVLGQNDGRPNWFQHWALWNGRLELWCMYLPCLGIVLKRAYTDWRSNILDATPTASQGSVSPGPQQMVYRDE